MMKPNERTKTEGVKWWHHFLIGIGSITVFPTFPEPELGDISDDWRAVGNDIRSAMKGVQDDF
jgi:hypothetical protein